mgnify:FL=1
MQVNLMTFLVQYLTAQVVVTLVQLRAIQQSSIPSYPIFRCPQCRARLFDGWLMGTIKCWRCAKITTGYVDKFVEALSQVMVGLSKAP